MMGPSATPSQRTRSAARDPRSVELSPRAGGSFGALSSDGHTVYSVRPVGDTWQCQCPGYAARQTCCHSLAAALPRCSWCTSPTDLTVYVNHCDNDAEVTLCRDCFAPKEVA